MNREMLMVLDLQFGSTGKGQIAGTLGRMWEADGAVCANGPNAGHTYRWTDENDHPDHRIKMVVHTVLPIGAVLPSVRNIMLGPGASFSLDRLYREIREAGELLRGKRLIIHPNATIVGERHREAEKAFVKVGSTMKGTAEANIEKMRRIPGSGVTARAHKIELECIYSGNGPDRFRVIVDYDEYDRAIDSSKRLLVEGAQGASLSMHSQFYPHCTSRDVSLAQVWADCRLPHDCWRDGVRVVGVCRTYPIRVANRYDDNGTQIGSSGAFYDDQTELDWAKNLGREPELTTVTKLPRRIFTFSTLQIIEACRYCAPDFIALTFCDYLAEEHATVGSKVSEEIMRLLRRVELASGKPVRMLSYGPNDTDIFRPIIHVNPPEHRPLSLPWEGWT